MSKGPVVKSSSTQLTTVIAKADSYWTVELGSLREVVRLTEDLPEKAMVTAVMGDPSATYVGERLVRELIVRGEESR